MRGLFYRYLVTVGVIANAVVLAVALSWAYDKVVSSERYRDFRRSVAGPLDGVSVTPISPVLSGEINPGLHTLPTGVWFKIHQQVPGETESFSRQAHGGAAFDPTRGRLMLFGSDTHRKNWDNSVRFFDMGTLQWTSAYPPDSPDSYRVNREGIPVAGEGVERPWAMHAFDAVEFDPLTDRMIVASMPSHMSPAKSWGMKAALWEQIGKHPTWFYHVGENRWEPMQGKAVSFFPYAMTFDPYRRAAIGVNPNGYWELSGEPPAWHRIGTGSPKAWHVAAVYDSDSDVVVSFGTEKRADHVWQYRRGEKKGERMPTPGIRPPGADSAPMAYHPRLKKVVALVERPTKNGPGSTETWLYSSANDVWSQLETASLPFGVGMNYDMVYDPRHNLLVLVANAPGEPVAVWALRLDI